MESLVPSLETCKQLKEAGFPQETALVWDWIEFANDQGYPDEQEGVRQRTSQEAIVAAPTAQEVMEPLKESRHGNLMVGYDQKRKLWYAGYELSAGMFSFFYENLALVEALSSLYIEVSSMKGETDV